MTFGARFLRCRIVRSEIFPAVARALALVRREWGGGGPLRQLRLSELADAAAVSTGHLARAFSAEFGIGFASALERLRLVHAASMLCDGSQPLAVIATTCGFADQYHFSRRFAAAYGMPPGRYRSEGKHLDIDAPLAECGLQALAEALFPATLIEQVAATPAPPPLQASRSYGQTFTVPWGFLLTQVSLYLATWSSNNSAVTMTLYRMDTDNQREQVASRRVDPMTDNRTEWMSFPTLEHGRFLIELTDPRGTPTWWWHQGADVADVGGSARIDDLSLNHTNFIFAATITGPG